MSKIRVPHSPAAGDYSKEAKASAEGGRNGCLDNALKDVGNNLEIFLQSNFETPEKSLQRSINVDEHLKDLAYVMAFSPFMK